MQGNPLKMPMHAKPDLHQHYCLVIIFIITVIYFIIFIITVIHQHRYAISQASIRDKVRRNSTL